MGMIIPILIGTFAGIISLIIEVQVKKKKAAKREQLALYPYKQQYERLMKNSDNGCCVWSPYYSFDENQVGEDMAEKAMKQRVLDMPQLTFERWLTFYNNKPEAWVIQKQENRKFANIPYYQKTTQHETKNGKMKDFTVFVPTFWTSPEEMKKYRDWVENEYQSGRAAEFEQQRDKNMQTFVNYMQEDVVARRAVVEAELQKAREQVRQSTPAVPKLKLSDGTEVAVDPTYHGQPITKYNGQTTASYVQYRQRPGYIFMYNGEPVDLKGYTGDIRYDRANNIIYVYSNDNWVELK